MIGVGEGGVVTTNTSIAEKTKLIASRYAPFRTKKDLLEKIFLQW